MPKFNVTYEKVLPGWDEFGKSHIDTIRVEAPTKDDSFKVAEAQLGKYCMAFQSQEVE